MRNSIRSIGSVAGALALAIGASACAMGEPHESASDASVMFSAPADGASIAGGVPLTMTASGITIEKSGDVHDNAGHFHVIADHGCTETGAAIAKDADHVHFGAGQSEGVIYLEPGSHQLCLQVGDGQHVALAVTDTVNVEIGIDSREQWCAVVGAVDVLFEATDTSSDDFAVRQIGYENVRRLFRQLEDGLDQVDADAQDAVAASLAYGSNIANIFIAAASQEEATATLQPSVVDDGVPGPIDPAAEWIKENCGVEIDS